MGQLVRFNDAVANKTYTYTYDNNGNILTKSEYAYTLNDELGTATNITNFGYEAEWKDRLSTVGDKTITYDNIGNPTSYLGATLTWEGRELKSYENDEKHITYEYDENGMRYRTVITDKISDENSTLVIDYIWLGEKLVSMVVNYSDGTTLSAKYLYNSSGEVIGLNWVNGTDAQSTFYYLKNLQGDITGIVNATGKMQISFNYDVFGKMTTKYHFNLSSSTWFDDFYNQLYISALNPFGYRGYCLDGYTELYYLQSRYYDPNTGRFINADDTNYLNATGTVLGCNLFAYCENDPVNRVDPSGYFAGDDHYKITYEIAKKYFNEETAIALADFSKIVDEIYPPVKEFYSAYSQSFHFDVKSQRIGSKDSRDVRKDEFIEQGIECLKNASKSKKEKEKKLGVVFAIMYFGMALHPLQDKVAHSGPLGNADIRIYDSYGNYTVIFYFHLGTSFDDPTGEYLNTGKTKESVAKSRTRKQIKKYVKYFKKYKLYKYVK